MNGSFFRRPISSWAALFLAVLATLTLMVALLAASINAGYFQRPLLALLAARSGREIQVQGSWQAQLFSWHPRLTAERVIIGNPRWTPAGHTAEIGKVSLILQLPWFHRSFGIEKLELEAATLHLARDSAGRANWQLTDPNAGGGEGLPLIRSLSIQNARVELADALRHLQFAGTVSVGETEHGALARPLHIDGAGQLNGRADTFGISSDPLALASHDEPYRFTFVEHSSGSTLAGKGLLLHAFKFDAIDASFEAGGEDLKDLYFLAGVTLVNTAGYHMTGQVSRRGNISRFSNLRVTTGQSDIRGRISIETTGGRPRLDIDLESPFLRMSDLGARAAGRQPKSAPPLLLSDAMVNPDALRRVDGLVKFHAQTVEVAHVLLRGLVAEMNIDHGIVTLDPLRAEILEGRLNLKARLDATQDPPSADIDLRISDLQIARLSHTDAAVPPYEGLLRARLTVTGKGRSIHQVAASANGTVTAVLPHGLIRASLAELMGLDLRALGLLASKNTRETAIRCGVASFQARQGVLTAQNWVIDTDPVRLTGNGNAHLDSESLDFTFRGHSNGMRLAHLRVPIFLQGTLAHPTIHIQAAHAVAQAAEAVAAGVVLTPLAAILAFVDPELPKDENCGALLSAAPATPR